MTINEIITIVKSNPGFGWVKYVAVNKDGAIRVYENKPFIHDSLEWWAYDSRDAKYAELQSCTGDVVENWKQSLIEL